jgi:hypothetical protein
MAQKEMRFLTEIERAAVIIVKVVHHTAERLVRQRVTKVAQHPPELRLADRSVAIGIERLRQNGLFF